MEEQLRFPIGEFKPVLNLSQAQRETYFEEILDLPKIFRATVQNLTMEQLLARYRPGGWTVHQVVNHLADNDMNAFIRFKKALTKENPTASSSREDLWAELSDFSNTPIDISLSLIDAIHTRFEILLRSLSSSDFQRPFTSPTNGEMNLDIALQRFVWHGRHHNAQIDTLKHRMKW